MTLRSFLVLLTAALIVLLLLTVWFFPPNEDFRAENPFWNGTRDLSSLYAARPLESLSGLPPTPQGTTLILIPYLSFDPGELAPLESFVTGGGTLVLADDFGYGNQLLEYLGLPARFANQAILDPLANHKNRQLPRISRLAPDPLTRDATSLVLNHATCLLDVAPASVLASSSSFSFLDRNGNHTRDEDEPTGPLPVISRHRLGSGQVILVADPSIVINAMAAMDGNRAFLHNIATTGSLFIDQSHLPPSERHQTRNLLARIRGFLTTPPGTLGLVTVLLAIALRPIWHRKKEDPAEAPPPL